MRKLTDEDTDKKAAAVAKAKKAWKWFGITCAVFVGWLWYLHGYTQGMEAMGYRPGDTIPHSTK